jgi:hypothetical protein
MADDLDLSNVRSRGVTLLVPHAGRWLSITMGAPKLLCSGMMRARGGAVRLLSGKGGGVVGEPYQVLIQVQ